MAQLQIAIAGRDYTVSCADGEEERLVTLGRLIDDKLRSGAEPSGLSETRALLYAALFLADEVHDLRQTPQADPDLPSAKALENLADRVEAVASRLENGATNA